MLEERVADESLTGYRKEYYTEELDKRGKGKAGSYRTCSFCDNKGHDRRTCAQLNTVVENNVQLVLEGRKKFIRNATDTGFGVGRLIEISVQRYLDGKWTNVPTVCVVAKIDWTGTTHRTLEANGKTVSVTFYEGKKERCENIRIPFELMEMDDDVPESHYARQTKLIAPGSGPVTIPDNFFDVKIIKKIVKEWTRNSKAYQY
tara:strand:+ start:301 stop:909 length:609 start_codon:yes stop_codon:yes gene_type:complete